MQILYYYLLVILIYLLQKILHILMRNNNSMSANVVSESNQVEPTEPAINEAFIIISLQNAANYSLSLPTKYLATTTYKYLYNLGDHHFHYNLHIVV